MKKEIDSNISDKKIQEKFAAMKITGTSDTAEKTEVSIIKDSVTLQCTDIHDTSSQQDPETKVEKDRVNDKSVEIANHQKELRFATEEITPDMDVTLTQEERKNVVECEPLEKDDDKITNNYINQINEEETSEILDSIDQSNIQHLKNLDHEQTIQSGWPQRKLFCNRTMGMENLAVFLPLSSSPSCLHR